MKRFAVAAVFLVWSVPALAQDESKASDRVLQPLRACRGLPDAERLACYDKAAQTLDDAVKGEQVTILDQQEVRKTRRSLFGFTLPRIGLFSGRDGEEEGFSEINTTVESARALENGRVEIRLADDDQAVWRTTDPMNFPPRTGDKIRIRKGALGNFFLSVGGRSYRGVRIR